MSTRAIIALQKGNHARYCFLHWDGDIVDRRLKEMLDVEIEDLYNKLSPVDTGKSLCLEHMYSGAEWEARREHCAKTHPEMTREQVSAVYLDQPTAYGPVPGDSSAYELPCGDYYSPVNSPAGCPDALGSCRAIPPYVEHVWHYNLDTRKITSFVMISGWKQEST